MVLALFLTLALRAQTQVASPAFRCVYQDACSDQPTASPTEVFVIEEILDMLLDRRLIAIVTLLVGCFILRDVVRTLIFIVDAGRRGRRSKDEEN